MRNKNKLETDVTLLDQSILHWQRIIKGVDEPRGEQCVLCDVYAAGDACSGCPVREDTNKDSCSGTPFAEASREFYGTDNEIYHQVRMKHYLIKIREKLKEELKTCEPPQQQHQFKVGDTVWRMCDNVPTKDIIHGVHYSLASTCIRLRTTDAFKTKQELLDSL